MKNNLQILFTILFFIGSLGIASGQNLQQLFEIENPDGDFATAHDKFGTSISKDGDWLVVGAPFADSSLVERGAAYVFHRDSGGINNWGLVQRLVPPTSDFDIEFGKSVAIEGNILIVGAPEDDNRGALYRYRRPNGTTMFDFKERVAPVDLNVGDQFGYATAIKLGVMMVGCPGWDGTGYDQGKVFNYITNGATVQLFQQLEQVTADSSRFGSSIYVEGNRMIIGAPHENTNGSKAGAAHVYVANTPGTGWFHNNKLLAPDGAPGDRFGTSGAVSNGYAVIGSPFDDDIASQSGSIYLFKTGGAFQKKYTLSSPVANERFGFKVAMSEDYVVATSLGTSTNNIGKGHLYERGGDTLLYHFELTGVNSTNGDKIGEEVVFDGNELFLGGVGMQPAGINSGGILFMEQDTNNNWTENPIINGPNGGIFDLFGSSIDINDNYMAVGASRDARFGDYNGSVSIFKEENNVWSLDTIFYPILNSFAGFGHSLTLDVDRLIVGSNKNKAVIFMKDSLDTWREEVILSGPAGFGSGVDIKGNLAVIGAKDANGGAGIAYVYEYNGSTWNISDTLTPSDPHADKDFGNAVTIEGELILVGAQKDDSNKNNSGAAYIFKKSGPENWDFHQKIKAGNPGLLALFGTSLDMQDSTIMIGASHQASQKGAVYFFEPTSSGNWELDTFFIPTTNFKQFGFDVDLSNYHAIAGAHRHPAQGYQAGAAYVITREINGKWKLNSPTFPTQTERADWFGHAVALNEEIVLIGQPEDHSNFGTVPEGRVYGYQAPPSVPVIDSITYPGMSYCIGDTVQVSIHGALNLATQWSIYSDSCGGVLLESSSQDSIAIIPVVLAMNTSVLYIRGEGGQIINPDVCQSLLVPTSDPGDAGFFYDYYSYCKFDTADPSPTITGDTGIFNSSPSGLSLNSLTGAINLGNTSAGIYSITFSTTGQCPSDSTINILIDSTQDASFYFLQDSFCKGPYSTSAQITGNSGGRFSATPSTLIIDSISGLVNINLSPIGVYTLTYTLSDPFCGNSTNEIITIHNHPSCFIYPDDRVYVDSSATTSFNDGTSWAQAFTTLDEALTAIQTLPTIRTIYMAQGNYYPDTTVHADPRRATYNIPDSTRIVGGFPSGGGAFSSRDVHQFKTILNGDIDRDQTLNGNSYTVVNIKYASDSTIIDGVHIVNGNADLPGSVFTAYGGGLFNLGTGSGNTSNPQILNCTFENNKAFRGGAIYNHSQAGETNMRLVNCEFYQNTVSAFGGAICDQTGTGTSNLEILNCQFKGNQAAAGAGLCIFATNGLSNLSFTNTVCSGNKANGGGALYLAGNGGEIHASILNSTFSGNSVVGAGGAISAFDDNGLSSLQIANTIIWNNQSGSGMGNASSSLFSTGLTAAISSSLVQSITISDTLGNLSGLMNPLFVQDSDPTLAPSLTGNLQLQSLSSCINTGDTDVAVSIAEDVNGNERIIHDHVDMGAYESQLPWPEQSRFYVDVSKYVGNGRSWDLPFRYLQDALQSSLLEAGDSIFIAKGYYYPDDGLGIMQFDTTESFTIPDSIIVLGGFSPVNGINDVRERNPNIYKTVLSGDLNHDGTFDGNADHVIITYRVSDQTIIDGLIIRDGHGLSGGGWQNNGSFSVSNPLIKNCVITHNYSPKHGGGFHNLGFNGIANPTFINCVFSDNEAEDTGGALYNYGLQGNSSPVLINCLLVGNLAKNAGGIYNQGHDGISSPKLINTTISGNRATSIGGAISSRGTGGGLVIPELVNSIVYNNQDQNGTDTLTASIINSSSSVLYFNSLIAGISTADSLGNIDGSLDPMYVLQIEPLQAPTDSGNYQLTYESPALNVGANDSIPFMIDEDLEGSGRIHANIIDLGAYEFNYVFPCGFYSTLNIDDNPIYSAEYKAVDTISSTGHVSSDSEGPVAFKSENMIHLNSGFEVKLGEEFDAIIEDPCQE